MKMKAALVVATFLTFFHVQDASSRNRYDVKEMLEIDGHNYYFGLTNVNWAEADLTCFEMGMQLLTLDTRAKTDFWTNWLKEHPSYDMWTWTSGRREFGTTDWIWNSTGQLFDPNELSWAVNQPNNPNTLANCVDFRSSSEGWDDDVCESYILSYICEELYQS